MNKKCQPKKTSSKKKKLKPLLNQKADDVSARPIYFGHIDSVKQMRLLLSHGERNFTVTGRPVQTVARPSGVKVIRLLTLASTRAVSAKVQSFRFERRFKTALKKLMGEGVDFYTTEHTKWAGNTFHWTAFEMAR